VCPLDRVVTVLRRVVGVRRVLDDAGVPDTVALVLGQEVLPEDVQARPGHTTSRDGVDLGGGGLNGGEGLMGGEGLLEALALGRVVGDVPAEHGALHVHADALLVAGLPADVAGHPWALDGGVLDDVGHRTRLGCLVCHPPMLGATTTLVKQP
jgi:hypothetical protein